MTVCRLPNTTYTWAVYEATLAKLTIKKTDTYERYVCIRVSVYKKENKE